MKDPNERLYSTFAYPQKKKHDKNEIEQTDIISMRLPAQDGDRRLSDKVGAAGAVGDDFFPAAL